MGQIDVDFSALSDLLASKMLYLVGNPRGGSTYSCTAIGMHPDILEIRWNDTVFDKVWPHRGIDDSKTWRDRLLRGGHFYDEAIILNRIGPQGLRHLQEHIEDICLRRDLKSVMCLAPILYWLMKTDLHDITGIKKWIIKSNTWRGVNEVAEGMPEATFIFVERDPRSTALSMAKVFSRARGESFQRSDLIKGSVDWLRNATEYRHLISSYSPRSHVVKYENLVLNPIHTLNALYTDLDCPACSGEEIEQNLSEIFYKRTRATGEPTQNKRGAQTTAIDRWTRQLDQREVALIESLTAPAASYYGYELSEKHSWTDAVKSLSKLGAPKLFIKEIARYFYCRLKLYRRARTNPPGCFFNKERSHRYF